MATCLNQLRSNLVRSQAEPAHSFYFDGGTEDVWSAGLSNCTVDFDTSNICHDPNSAGQNRRITKSAEGVCNFRQDFVAFDISGTHGVLECYFPPLTLFDTVLPGNTPRLEAIRVFMYNVGGTNASTTTIYMPNQELMEGWKSIPIILDDLVGTVDLTAVTRILFQVEWDTGLGDQMTFDRLYFVSKPATGRIFVRFDDSYDDHYGYCNTATTNGFTCSLATIPNQIDGVGRLTLAELRELYANGHRVVNHCNDISSQNSGTLGGWVYTDLTEAALTSIANRRTGINSAAETLISWGMREHARTVIVPGGYTNPGTSDLESDRQLIIDGDVSALWYAAPGDPGGGGNPRSDGVTRGRHDWGIRAKYQMDGILSATVQAKIQDCINKKYDLTIYGHQTLVDWATTAAFIKTEVDAGNLEVGTIGDLVAPNYNYPTYAALAGANEDASAAVA